MSMWQFFAAINGYSEAHSSQGSKLTESEAEELFEWLEDTSSGPRTLSTQTYWWEGDWPEPAGVVAFTIQ